MGQKSGMGLTRLKPGVSSAVDFLEAVKGSPFPCLFQLLEATCISWLLAPFLHLQSHQNNITLTLFLSELPSRERFSAFRDSCA